MPTEFHNEPLTDFTKEEMRSWALKVLAAMAGLSRDRVLKHALKVNQI